MKKHPLLFAGYLISLIVSACSILTGISYITKASSATFAFYKYCASILFVFAAVSIILLAIGLAKVKSLKSNSETTKILTVVSLIFLFIMLVLQGSSLFVYDFSLNVFIVTVVLISMIAYIFGIVFMIIGMAKSFTKSKDSANEKLEELYTLLTEKKITPEEYNEKRKQIIDSI